MRLKILYLCVALLATVGMLKAQEAKKNDSIKLKRNRMEVKADSCSAETADKTDISIGERKDNMCCEKKDSTRTTSKIKNSKKKIEVL